MVSHVKVLLGGLVGFMAGFLIHLVFTPPIYTISYQSRFEFWDSNNTDDEVDESLVRLDMDIDMDVLEKVRNIVRCDDVNLRPSIKQRGKFWVLYNYVPAERKYKCYETITLTTIGDFAFLDNLVPLVERWKGPISVALNTPGDDFYSTVDAIAYLRNCEMPLIRRYVTFHLFFEDIHTPMQLERMVDYYEKQELDFDCNISPPYVNVSTANMYKSRNNLTYPINVARNVARETVQTHFVFASDIELYPTRNLIRNFLEMVANNEDHLFTDDEPKVFVLPIFEILEDKEVPENKTHLEEMYKNEEAFLFHGKLCKPCHAVPKLEEWLEAPETTGLRVFSEAKRVGKFNRWEAFYIGTNEEPLFDERLSWEGQSNKMIQQFAMCLVDYNYMVLDNAYLIHKPGIKKKKVQMQIYTDVIKATKQMIKDQIKPQLEIMYGKRRGCFVV